MKFADAVRSVLSQYATFSGRARRSEYWFFVLFNVLVSIVAAALDRAVGSDLGAGTGIVSSLAALALLVPGLAVSWRRLHDTGRSGGWFFIVLVPFAGPVVLIVFQCLDSQAGANRFGPSPKGELSASGYPQAPTWS